MNSAVTVETPALPGPDQKRYIVALMSNVLRVNSAWDPSRLGAAIDQMIRSRTPATVYDSATKEEKERAGSGD